MDSYDAVYDYKSVDGIVAQFIHTQMGFGAKEKYKGGLFVQARSGDSHVSVSARSDAVFRDFVVKFGGETILTERLPSPHVGTPDHIKTTTRFPDGRIHQQVGLSESRWLEGAEAKEEDWWHKHLATTVSPVAAALFEPPESAPALKAVSRRSRPARVKITSAQDFINSLKKLSGPG